MKPDRTIEVYSQKYQVTGKIQDFDMVVKLVFTYEGREHTIGIKQPFDADLALTGLSIMETAIERLITQLDKVFLHYWYIEKVENKMIAHGIVNGHPKLNDTTYINTTRINGVEVDTEKEEAIIITKNTTYHCPLIYWNFKGQDKYPDAVEKYDELKALYNGRISLPEIEHGKVLLVLSDFDEYYFHSLCVKDDKGQNAEYRGDPHIGTFQDSYLISARTQNIDIRYFPHYRSIEFYSLLTNDMPLYIENIGYGDIFIINNDKKFCIHSGERKAYNELTIVEGIGILPDGDLYPAMT